MDKNLHNFRKSYKKGSLTEDTILEDPMQQFGVWFLQAEKEPSIEEPNAMTLSTVDAQGIPRGRVVLLKEYSSKGFIFYTNYSSDKGQAIAKNNHVCVSFFWPGLERQIIITGTAAKISEQQSSTYFNKRPRESQLGAVVHFDNKTIVKPANWGGYLIQPTSYEFWQGRSSRLHDRIKYIKNNTSWRIVRLQP